MPSLRERNEVVDSNLRQICQKEEVLHRDSREGCHVSVVVEEAALVAFPVRRQYQKHPARTQQTFCFFYEPHRFTKMLNHRFGIDEVERRARDREFTIVKATAYPINRTGKDVTSFWV